MAAGVEKVEAKRLSMIDGMYVVCQVNIDNHVDVFDFIATVITTICDTVALAADDDAESSANPDPYSASDRVGVSSDQMWVHVTIDNK